MSFWRRTVMRWVDCSSFSLRWRSHTQARSLLRNGLITFLMKAGGISWSVTYSSLQSDTNQWSTSPPARPKRRSPRRRYQSITARLGTQDTEKTQRCRLQKSYVPAWWTRQMSFYIQKMHLYTPGLASNLWSNEC